MDCRQHFCRPRRSGASAPNAPKCPRVFSASTGCKSHPRRGRKPHLPKRRSWPAMYGLGSSHPHRFCLDQRTSTQPPLTLCPAWSDYLTGQPLPPFATSNCGTNLAGRKEATTLSNAMRTQAALLLAEAGKPFDPKILPQLFRSVRDGDNGVSIRAKVALGGSITHSQRASRRFRLSELGLEPVVSLARWYLKCKPRPSLPKQL